MALFKGLIRDCVVCGGEYKSPQSHAHVLTCSRTCGYKNRVVANKKEKVSKPCAHCGEAMLLSPSQVPLRTYCSNECREASPATAEMRHVRYAGPANPGWQGGLSVSATSATGKTYRRQQPHIENERSARRKRAIERATPAWADVQKMRAIYLAAQRLSRLTGAPHHVDHIVPLTSTKVCGLHCEANLEVLPGVENLKKSNRKWPDMS